ncbi:MAG: dihydrofolate reductase [Burkholderiaceae bacterium]|nr:dihydrofolate reductase [Burkholderiaceae bacterium]
MVQLVLLAAVGHRRVIGIRNALPWHLPEDLKHFKTMTTGHVVVMGRKTFESIVERLGRPLPDRHSVVITRNRHWKPTWPKVSQSDQVSVVHDIDQLQKLSEEPIFVIGGAEIYALTLPMADRLEITEVEVDVEGDAFFPEISQEVWVRKAGPDLHSESSNLRYRFVQYLRRISE